MLIYTHDNTPRFNYIASFIGQEIAGQQFSITTDPTQFIGYAGPRINYSHHKLSEDEFWILPHSLLFEKGVRQQHVECFESDGQCIFFKTGGDISFDILAAAFYLISRYEEYLPHASDIYGRYAHENSLAFRKNFLQKPIINQWIDGLKDRLRIKFPGFIPATAKFSYIASYDIDEAFSYKHKGAWRTLGGIAKSLFRANWDLIAERWKVLRGKLNDPFDSYDWMDQVNAQFELDTRYFFLLAARTGKYDRNILPSRPVMQSLVKRHSGKYRSGIHPSWQSGDDPALLQEEIRKMEEITNKPVRISRQHFIRFALPETYRHLISTGITEDYSMGYGSINGFRASVTIPFYWFDLEKEESTGLKIFPFCYMEANSFFEDKLSPSEGLDEMKQLYKAVKEVDGLMITIWHNTFLGNASLFRGWREAYVEFLSGVRS